MSQSIFVHCERKGCKYFIHDENEGGAYQDQCGNDEIEIGADRRCYSYEERKDENN